MFKVSKIQKQSSRILVAVFLCLGFQGLAQVKAPQITPLSPNAAALWKYSELPVNLYTGIPTISIPIYEIKNGNLTVPISLSYHAGGIRYEEQASWVGLGWTLNAGGAITRNVKGVADEKAEGILNQPGQLNLNAQPCDYTFFESVVNKWKDVEPDEFSYTTPNKVGRFIYQQGVQQPTTIPYEPLKFNYTVGSGSLSNFQITDESGTIYSYGAPEATSGGSGLFVADNFPTSWQMTQIQSADLSKSINFNYAAGAGAVQKLSKTDNIRVLDNVSGYPGGSNPQSFCQAPLAEIFSYVSTSLVYMTNTQYLTQILFDNGKVEFVQSSANRTDLYENQKSLEYIRIYSLSGGVYTLVKSVKFFYTYFKKLNNSVLQDYKLKLDKIQVLDSDGVVQEEYNFQYLTTTFSGDRNNPQDFNAQDWWGFYNGKVTNTNMVPQQNITYVTAGGSTQQSIGGADRNVYPEYMTEGVLKKIIYPTGGYTEFEFESHLFEESGPKYAGGLRVKKITSQSSANDVPLIKTYKYGPGNNGYGKKMFSNYMGYYSTDDRYICIQTLFYVGEFRYNERNYTSVSSMQIDGFEGSPVVYPYVSVYTGTEITNNGRVEYVYDYGSPVSDNFYLPYYGNSNMIQRQSNHYLRGYLTSTKVYNSENIKVSESTTTYQTLHSIDQLAGLLVDQRFFLLYENPSGCWMDGSVYRYSYNYYPVRSGAVRPLKTTEIVYDPGNPGRSVTNETNYVFDGNYLQPLEISKSLRKLQTGYEEQVINYSKYPFNYSFTGAPSGNEAQGIKLLQDKNISAAPIEQYTVKKFRNPTVWQSDIIAGIITIYSSDKPYPEKVWQIETSTPIASASFGSGSSIISNAFSKNSAYKEKLAFISYDPVGNITEYNKTNDVTNTYIWDYLKMYPVAEVANAGNASIAFTSFEAENKGNWTFTGTPGTETTPPPTGKKAYTLNGSNDITRSGLSTNTTYIVSYWVKSASPLTIAGTQGAATAGRNFGSWYYFEHRITGQSQLTISGTLSIDELRLYPVGAVMTTYTHEPLIGLSSKCDPGNRISYYEYDKLGRLQLIRDQDRNIIKTFEYKYKTP